MSRAWWAEVAAAASAAGDATDSELAELWTGLGDGASSDGAVDAHLAMFLARILTRRGPDSHDYLGRAVVLGGEELTEARHGCGCRLLVVRLQHVAVRDGVRLLWICERCGKVAEVPDGTVPPQRRLVDQRTLEVDWPTPVWATIGYAPIGGHHEADAVVRRVQPRDGVVRVQAPVARTPGLRRLAVVLVSGGEVRTLQEPVYLVARSVETTLQLERKPVP